MNKLEAFITSIPYIKIMMREDVMITVFDHEKYIYYAPTKDLNFHYQIGGRLPDMYLDYALVDLNKTVVLKVPKEEFGIPFDSISFAIKDDGGQVLGAVNVAVTTDKTTMLNEIIESVESISHNLLEKVQHIVSFSDKRMTTTDELAKQTESTMHYSTEIKDVASSIKMVSDQTNLLGLNAAIEAARVGHLGAGFGVVAQEIRKLSQSSKEATMSIEQTLHNITESLQSMHANYDEMAETTQQESQLVTQFMLDLQQLQKTSENIRDYFTKYVMTK